MSKSWICHWQYKGWNPDVNGEYEPLCSSGNNTFTKRGVKAGDVLYIVSLFNGQLYLGGSMTVKRLVSRAEAVKVFKTENLWEADEWAIDDDRTGTPLNFHRRLAPSLTRRIRFVSSKDGEKGLCFEDERNLNGQATRSLLLLTSETTDLLDKIIELTDAMPRKETLVTVTEDMLSNGK